MFKIRKIMILLLIVLLASPMIALAKPLQQIKLALDWYINPIHAPILVAQQLGYFKQQGIKLVMLTPVSVSAPIKLLATSQADIALTYSSRLFIEQQAKMPIAEIGTLINQPLESIAVLKTSPIHHLKQLENKVLGYSGSMMSYAIIRQMLIHAGVDPQSVHLVNVKMDLTQALLSHKVDAVCGMFRNIEPVQLALIGFKTRLFFPENFGIPPYSELVFVSLRHNKHKALFHKFLMAITEGVKYLKAHPQKAWQLVAENPKFNLTLDPQTKDFNHKIWLASIPYFSSQPAVIDRQQKDRFFAFMKKYDQQKYNY